jgi:hypothetical protein
MQQINDLNAFVNKQIHDYERIREILRDVEHDMDPSLLRHAVLETRLFVDRRIEEMKR